jgi:mannosyl-3-phosphoglycerate phosphatase
MRFIVFTDLDGTLLDHDTYDWGPAARTIERIRTEGWPLVFVTSKTRAEVERLRTEIGVDEPFIVENGAAAFFPARYDGLELPEATRIGAFRAIVLGRPYQEVREFVTSCRDRFDIEGFGDMGVERIQEVTGLSEDAAQNAAMREFTEPFLVPDDASLPGLRAAAEEAGFAITTGGRLHHLIGADQDKGRAVAVVREALERSWGERPVTIGLGDGPNDVPMLEAVDYPVIVPAPGRPLPDVRHPHVSFAPAEGPRGWAEALTSLFRQLAP